MNEARNDRSDASRGVAGLIEKFRVVRASTERLCEPLAVEDFVLQNMADVSPTKWHLAHTSWFFERFVLQEQIPGYEPFDDRYYYLFNSYYTAAGPMHCRPMRGQISRPTVQEVFEYRSVINGRLLECLTALDEERLERALPVVEIGCHHEQQHQELLLTDIKYNLSCNPLLPVYRALTQGCVTESVDELRWASFEGGIHDVGHSGEGFAYDNEGPRHQVLLRDYALASRLVTNGEYLAFVQDGGYARPELWLSLGSAAVASGAWSHPLYWYEQEGDWMQFTLGGPAALDLAEPVCHLSYFEADAYARWAGVRLPTEAEWEVAVARQAIAGNFSDSRRCHVLTASSGAGGLDQAYGDVWEWTASPYVGYPGYRAPEGAIGEYNGKFMCNQFVLRGGSCATPRDHIRRTYRNFFPPDARWQFAGLRLAKDL